MSRKTRNTRIAMLSPLAFALAFGAYAGTTQTGREQRLSATYEQSTPIRREDEDELGWLTEWLERHGQS
ncbi:MULTISPECIES: hypothetical protein [Thioclava]|uniref:Uncharacterized protein n=1 Tax=Thioclava indica TaxID=1353528 RepID=A0A074JA16_9RHOB|nr:hypothetical protein [Thioclava indica]KEO53394.1 hypothetical protein DT23_18475 [Thioclava indica]